MSTDTNKLFLNHMFISCMSQARRQPVLGQTWSVSWT